MHAAEHDGVLLLGEGESHWLSGALYRELAPLLNGRHTVQALIARLKGRFSAAEVRYALHRLEAKGLLAEFASELPPERAAYWSSLGVEPRQAEARVESARVRLLSLGRQAASGLGKVLRSEGVRVVRSRDVALTVVLVGDYLDGALAEVNRTALRLGRPWLIARLQGREAWLGPCFVPGQTACWECLTHRLRAHRPVEAWLRRSGKGGAKHLYRAGLGSTSRAAVELLGAVVVRGLGTQVQGLAGTLAVLDVAAPRLEHHTVVRRPQCPECGDASRVAAAQEQPVVLQPGRKTFTRDGGRRGVAPAELVRRYRHHVSPLTGVVPRLEPYSGPASGVAPVFDAGPNLAFASGDMRLLGAAARSHSGGKGMSAAQAEASALAESIERFCGLFQGDEARRSASFQELGEVAIHPERYLLFSDRQYQAAGAQRAQEVPSALYVPARLEPDRRVDWTPLWSLTHGARRYLPTALCFYGHREASGPPIGRATSNGCAAGSTLEEAILQGFLELVERDGVALWWYNRLSRPRVALTEFDEPYVHALLAHYQELGREVWVLDLTSDLGIPVMAAISRRVDGGQERVIFGFGAHLQPELALVRALTELNQSLPYVDSPGTGDSSTVMGRWLRSASVAAHPYLAPAVGASSTPSSFQRLGGEEVLEDVRTCVQLARARGLEVLVLDQTRPDIGLPVVRVVVPGLRHFWPRLGPGRLYDVPVQLGWLQAPRAEEDLNPTPMVL